LLTSDGWSVERLTLEWPEESLLMVLPGADLSSEYLGRPAVFSKLAVESEVRAWGFSPTGRTLVLATSSDLILWGRSVEQDAAADDQG
jgi:hypothetical protein